MPFTVTMPKLSPTMEEGTITKWHKKVGDYVKAGELLFEVATDKATVEYNALDAGFLRVILLKEGKEGKVNQAAAIFTEKEKESIEGYTPEGIAPSSIEKEKPSVKKEAAKEEPTKEVYEKAFFQQPMFVPEAPLAHYSFPQGPDEVQGHLPASPLARKVAKEKGIDLTTVKGTGPNRRIMSRDLDLGQAETDVVFGSRETPHIPPGSYEEISLTPMRKAIGQKLQAAKTFIPHFYITQEVKADALFALREQLQNGGLKVSFNDFVIRACALSLRNHPVVNRGFHSVHSTIVHFKTIDISIAVSLEEGLITPIIRHADYKNLGEIALEAKSLSHKAREGKLKKEEYTGGSFTISNLGMYGITQFAGIINPPQAALLAVGSIEEKAVVEEGKLSIGKRMCLTLSADHRVVDGVEGAKFMKTVQKYVENPALLLVS